MTDHADNGAGVGLTGRPPRAIPEPKPRTSHGPAKVVAMCNQKGGVGKDHVDDQSGRRARRIRPPRAAGRPGSAGSAVRGPGRAALRAGPHHPQPAGRAAGVDRRRADAHPRQEHGPGAQQYRPVGRRDPAGQRGGPRADAGPRAASGAGPLRLRADRLPAVAGPAHRQRSGLLRRRDHPDRVRVLLAARPGAAHRHRREGARPAQPEAGDQRHLDHSLRPADGQLPRGDGPRRGALRRPGVRHRHHPHRPLPGDQRRRRTDHHAGHRRSGGAAAYRSLAREVIDRFGA